MEGSSADEEECGDAMGRDDACSSPAVLAAPPSAAAPAPQPGSDSDAGGAPFFCSPLAIISMAAADAEADGSSGRYVLTSCVVVTCVLEVAKKSIGQSECETMMHIQAAV